MYKDLKGWSTIHKGSFLENDWISVHWEKFAFSRENLEEEPDPRIRMGFIGILDLHGAIMDVGK